MYKIVYREPEVDILMAMEKGHQSVREMTRTVVESVDGVPIDELIEKREEGENSKRYFLAAADAVYFLGMMQDRYQKSSGKPTSGDGASSERSAGEPSPAESSTGK